MAASGKKRKRELQDENVVAADNFEYLRQLGESKKRRVTEEQKAPIKKLFEDQACTRELRSSTKFRSLRLTPAKARGLVLDSGDHDREGKSSAPSNGQPTFQRRNSLVRLRKPLTTFTGSLKSKLAEQVKRSSMRGQQDYSLPIAATVGPQDHLRFLSTLQAQLDNGQVPEEDQQLQQKIDHEIRMRDGTAKLLAASKHPQQMLEAAKNLLTSNARMLAYMGELQKRKTDEVLKREFPEDGNQVPCKAKISVSDIRIPLMWKDAEHFRSKGDHRRYAAFCIVKLGTEIYDTSLLKDIDRTMTDVMFDDVICFDDITQDFECKLEIYCHRCQDDLSVASTPKRIRKKIEDFGNSVGRSVGRRLSGLKDDSDPNMIIGPKFECIGVGTLKLANVTDSVGTFNLDLDADTSSTELPLFGNFCCRLAAQPLCLIQDTISGQLYLQDPGTLSWKLYWCRLRNLAISCWPKRDSVDIHAPEIVIPITKTTQVSEVPASLCKKPHCIQITSQTFVGRISYNMAAVDPADKVKWWDAIYQHLLDQVMWLQACETLMDIRAVTPRRHSVYRRKGLSLYDDTSVQDSSSPMTKMLNRLNIPEQREEEALAESQASNHSKVTDSKVTGSKVEEPKVTETTDIDSTPDDHSVTEITVVDAERPRESADSSASDKLDRVSQASSVSISSMELSAFTHESSSEEVPKLSFDDCSLSPGPVSDHSASESTSDDADKHSLETSVAVTMETAENSDSLVRERTDSIKSADVPTESDPCQSQTENLVRKSEAEPQEEVSDEAVTDLITEPQALEEEEVRSETQLLPDLNLEPEIMEEKNLISAHVAAADHIVDVAESETDTVQDERSESNVAEAASTAEQSLKEDATGIPAEEPTVVDTPMVTMETKEDSVSEQTTIPDTDNVFSTGETQSETTGVNNTEPVVVPDSELSTGSNDVASSVDTNEPRTITSIDPVEADSATETPQRASDMTESQPDSGETETSEIVTTQNTTGLPTDDLEPEDVSSVAQTETTPQTATKESGNMDVSPFEDSDELCIGTAVSSESLKPSEQVTEPEAPCLETDSAKSDCEPNLEHTDTDSADVKDQDPVRESTISVSDDSGPLQDTTGCSNQEATPKSAEPATAESEKAESSSPDETPKVSDDAPNEGAPLNVADKSLVRSLEDLVPTSYDVDDVSPGDRSVDDCEVSDSALETSGTFDASNVTEMTPSPDVGQEAGPSTEPTANGGAPTAKTTPSSGKKSRKRNRNKNKKKKKGGNKETSV